MAIQTLDDLVTGIYASQKTNKALTKADIKHILQDAFEGINQITMAGTAVRIHNFGTFKTKTRAARTGRNPQTGEAIQIAESTVLGFKPTKHGK